MEGTKEGQHGMPEFETFTRRLVPLGKEPRLTIQRRGTISMNESAYVALAAPDAVELLFAAHERIVGLRAVPLSCEHGYPVRSATGSSRGPFVVSAAAFIRFYGITTDISMRWAAYLHEGVLCADLRGEGTPVTSNRAAHDAKDALGSQREAQLRGPRTDS